MKLKQYIEYLQKFVKEHPEALEFKAIYAKDSEGNGFSTVVYRPSLGRYEDREFSQEDTPFNAVCIN